MRTWLTSGDRKRHQRKMNKAVRRFNKALEQDDLWLGRFVIEQADSQWISYDDFSGRELYVRLRFVDRATGRYYYKVKTVNEWLSFNHNCWRIFETMNWLITEHWAVWEEPLAKDLEMWRAYNKTTRKC